MISKALSLVYPNMVLPSVQEMNEVSSCGLLWLGMRVTAEFITVKNVDM